ncbi:hypothetical protein F0562_000347 [Nyssa sinensis]|uniref:FLZ-type domain-containing protein n=1 Tax=Nyssa sinensis TaxID=561372 RepID=A0A5J5BZS5_9ASTE|nr:hypothetical protein F0562_000347 [Nyssa sinensis]
MGLGKNLMSASERFLKFVTFARRNLLKDEDMYMYGGLRAFCTPECRDDQIALDGIGRKPSPIAEAFKVTKEPAEASFWLSSQKAFNSQV